MGAKLLRITDRYLGFPIYLSAGIISKMAKTGREEKGKVLAIKLWALGETITMMPALKGLKEKGYEIDVLVTSANKSILEGSDFIDELIVMEINPRSVLKTINYLRKKRFEYAVDFEPYTKFSAVIGYLSFAEKRIGFSNRKMLYTQSIVFNENKHAVKNFIDLANLIEKIDYPEKLVKLFVGDNDKKWAKELVGGQKKLLIGIHAGSAESSLSRRWSEENFAKLSDRLIEEYDAEVVLFGTEKELNEKIINMMENKAVNLTGKTTLKQTLALMERLDVFICNDSGPMHMAAAMGTKTIALFGPNSPKRYGPYGKGNISIYKKTACSPCIIVPRARFPECENPVCMKEITVDDVIKAVKKIR